MRTIEKYLIALYFFICPFEIALHLVVPSSTKYVGLMILLVEACILISKKREAIVSLSFSSISILLWALYCVISLFWTSLNNYTYEYITTYVLMSILLIVTTLELWDLDTINIYRKAYLLGSFLIAITKIKRLKLL